MLYLYKSTSMPLNINGDNSPTYNMAVYCLHTLEILVPYINLYNRQISE